MLLRRKNFDAFALYTQVQQFNLCTITLQLMSLDSLFPCAGDHAIQNAVFAVDFQRPLGSIQLKEVQKAAEKAFSSELPHSQEQQLFSLNLAVGQGAQQLKALPSQPGGFLMGKTADAPQQMLSRSIAVSPTNCTIIVPDYTRWDFVKADVDRYLDVILKIIGSHSVPIIGIGLQYTDVFHWNANPSELDMSEVFAKSTPYVVPGIFLGPGSGLWHSHYGHFQPGIGPIPYQQLINVNVNHVEAGGSHAIQILTSHKAQLKDPLWKIGKEHRKNISDIYDELHISNKEILSSLLSKELCNKIKLD